MENVESKQTIIDAEHLRLLSISHYIMGGISLIISLCIGLYFFIIMMMLKNSMIGEEMTAFGEEISMNIFSVLIIIISVIIIFAILISVGQIMSGIFIKNRKTRWFSYVIAGFNCLSLPFGIILGICTFIVLGRPSVKALYDQSDE